MPPLSFPKFGRRGGAFKMNLADGYKYERYILIKYLLITHQKNFKLDSRQLFTCMNGGASKKRKDT